MSEQVQTVSFNGRFNSVLEKNIGQAVDENVLKLDFVSVGLHSIAFVKLIVALENEFDLELEDAVLIPDNFSTVEEFRASVQQFVEERS
ncbi:acyl carrier protein [Paenibacillus pasadenensis]|uniref:acyl carrier protein n=1 Tax=Paenibacillus pasadenensis TaxID=217090 RepID=UPI0020406A66|nr:acyl carrier protein [Paenibacillus pasadenensis]MCM3746410.1 acyl carrier protein [Paenibacillus pasadenensis]